MSRTKLGPREFVFKGVDLTDALDEAATLDGLTSTVAELNILDGVTATAAELNILDTVTATAGELNMLDDIVDDVTIEYATGTGTDNIRVTLTVVDAAAVAIDAVHKLEVFITDDDIGGVLTSTAASGALTAFKGAILTALTAKKHVTMTTAADGIAVLDLVDSANTAGERFIVIHPTSGKVIVGAATVATDYEGGV